MCSSVPYGADPLMNATPIQTVPPGTPIVTPSPNCLFVGVNQILFQTFNRTCTLFFYITNCIFFYQLTFEKKNRNGLSKSFVPFASCNYYLYSLITTKHMFKLGVYSIYTNGSWTVRSHKLTRQDQLQLNLALPSLYRAATNTTRLSLLHPSLSQT